MEYTYDVVKEIFDKDAPLGKIESRTFTTTNLDELGEGHVTNNYIIKVWDNSKPNARPIMILNNKEDLEDWKIGQNESKARAFQWKAIDPDHYQCYMNVPHGGDYQWIEAMQSSKRFTFEEMNKALELQVRK